MLSIGQVAVQAGLRVSAIRYYEARGLLPVAMRRSGKRVYDEAILERLGVIELARIAGFGLDEIRLVLSDAGKGRPASTWRAAAQAKQRQIDEQIAHLAQTKAILERLASCECATMDACGRAFRAARSSRSLIPDP